ncbi:MAG: hypothetical protein ACXIVQ_14535 [Acidimicrobiales bacterium]
MSARQITSTSPDRSPRPAGSASEQVASNYAPTARDTLDLVDSWLVDPRTESRPGVSQSGRRIDLDGHLASFLGSRPGGVGLV